MAEILPINSAQSETEENPTATDIVYSYDIIQPEIVEPDDWQNKLLRGKNTYDKTGKMQKGAVKQNLYNLVIILTEHPQWKGLLAYDEFLERKIVTRNIAKPWGKRAFTAWTDNDTVEVLKWLQKQRFTISLANIELAVANAARYNKIHPVREYFNDLIWDGVSRLDRLAVTHFGADDTTLNREMLKCWIISSVARIYQPGCKADCMLVLEGEQGDLKSTALRTLTPKEDWFTDQIPKLDDKDSSIQLHGKMIIEFGELASFSRHEVEVVKSFLSRQVDTYRRVYGKETEDFPRQCVFAGSTNSDEWLKDETGGRRFWPIKCKKISIKAIEEDKEQIWAEAVQLYKNGSKWWLTDSRLIKAAEEEQQARFVADIWDEQIAEFIKDKKEVRVQDILEDLYPLSDPGHWSQTDRLRVTKCLKRLGLKQFHKKVNGMWSRLYRQ